MTVTRSERTVVVIPARYNSQRLPAKALATIGGKPMIQRVYERALGAHGISRVLVATDDQRIASVVRAFGGEALMTPSSLLSGTDRVAFAAQSIEDAEIIVNVQGDEPLLAPEMIDQGVELLTKNDTAGTLVRCIDSHEELMSPNVVKVVLDREGYCLYFSRSTVPFCRDHAQDDWKHHHTYYKHIGLYIFRRSFLLRFAGLTPGPLERSEKLEQLRILEHGFRIKAAITAYDSIPVDTPEDLDRVRRILQSNQ
ncbi:MAG: 3-deoxy-manno-octulosonate cytidylyltransferase [Ignavibacteriae bacterium]|nr:3-deoxy-manno-octulosonate cytidylyltransferase [Ignavibacteriota bacterium]